MGWTLSWIPAQRTSEGLSGTLGETPGWNERAVVLNNLCIRQGPSSGSGTGAAVWGLP